MGWFHTGVTYRQLADAALLVIGSDVAGGAVIFALVGAWALAGVFHIRAAIPDASLGTCLDAGPRVLLGLPAGSARTPTASAAGLSAAASSVTLRAVGPVSVAALAFLLVRGHPPVGLSTPLAAGGALALGSTLAVTVSHSARRADMGGQWRASRGRHLGVSALLGELTLSSATTLCAMALTHTGGENLSPLEAFAAASVARILTLLRFPPAGFVVADAVLAALLVGVGASPGAALATAALWRLGMLAAWSASALVRTRSHVGPGEDVAPPNVPTGSLLGELVHRSAFRLLGSLPPALARRARRLVFQSLFTVSEDPWQYAALPYEARKRGHLLDHVGPTPGTLVELGCADGHNLVALAQAHREARLVGLDISPRAVEVAQASVRGAGDVTVIEADFRGAPAALHARGITAINTLILSEVLYYLGGPGRIQAELGGLRDLLADGCRVLLLHPSPDAERLHPAALTALGAGAEEVVVMADPDRPVTLHVGRVSRTYDGAQEPA